MKLKTLLISSLIVMITGFVFIATLSTQLKGAQHELENAYKTRYLSYLLADELRQSSDDLTRLARTYVITGDDKYEKMYFDILDIRNGKKPRPSFYNRIYWDLVLQHGTKPRPDAETASLKELMKAAGFTDQEFAKLSEAQANSDGLVKAETIAMNMVKGLYDDGKGNFTVKGEPDFAKAREMMHDNRYHEYKANIMQPILVFQGLLDERTQASVDRAMSQVDLFTALQLLAFALLLVSLIMGARVAFMLYQRMTKLIHTVQTISDRSDFSIRADSEGADEVADISRAINVLMGLLQQSIAEANQVVGAIATADFTQRIKGDYVGELATLKQGVNDSAHSVSFMMAELESVMKQLNNGQFDVRMDARVPQAFRQSVENALGVIHSVIQNINQVMKKMNEGELDSRVSVNAPGELATLKQAVNTSLDTLDQLTNELVSMAQAQMNGDFTVVSTGQYSGRFTVLQHAREESTNRIKEVINLAHRSAIVVNNAAGELSQGSSDLSARVQEQAATLEETSATMNQMSAAVQANTANARKVAELTNQVQDQAKDGVQVMQQTISAMQSIKESSSKISDIVSIIDSIAFQTNLLALNAAVEAARAGEHGRGFAVVASEVRALAGKSADAAKDIKTLITDSVTRIENGTQLADKSGEMLNDIAGSIQHVAGMIEQIANASNEQSVGIGQVHLAIADIDKVTQENAALVEETTAAAESLTTEANNLRNDMAFFKTGTNTQALNNHGQYPKTKRTTSPTVKKLPSPTRQHTNEWSDL